MRSTIHSLELSFRFGSWVFLCLLNLDSLFCDKHVNQGFRFYYWQKLHISDSIIRSHGYGSSLHHKFCAARPIAWFPSPPGSNQGVDYAITKAGILLAFLFISFPLYFMFPQFELRKSSSLIWNTFSSDPSFQLKSMSSHSHATSSLFHVSFSLYLLFPLYKFSLNDFDVSKAIADTSALSGPHRHGKEGRRLLRLVLDRSVRRPLHGRRISSQLHEWRRNLRQIRRHPEGVQRYRSSAAVWRQGVCES